MIIDEKPVSEGLIQKLLGQARSKTTTAVSQATKSYNQAVEPIKMAEDSLLSTIDESIFMSTGDVMDDIESLTKQVQDMTIVKPYANPSSVNAFVKRYDNPIKTQLKEELGI